jgi:hypothetical protein
MRYKSENLDVDELIMIAAQYRSDLLHPIKDAGSIERRLERIDKILSTVEEL